MATTTYGSPYVENTGLVSAWPGVSLNVAQRIDSVSYAGNGVNAQTGTTYTLVLTDAGKNVTLSNASAVTVTVPTFASVAYAVGTVINLTNLGAGTVTVAAAGTVTVNGSPLTLAQYTQGQLLNTGTNTWVFTSAPVATTPGLTLITTQTMSAVATVSINNCFTSTYDNYFLTFRLTAVSGAADTQVRMRLRASGTDATGTDYGFQVLEATGASVSAGSNASQTGTKLTAIGNTYGNFQSAACEIFGPQLAYPTMFITRSHILDNAGGKYITTYAGGHNLSTAYDGLTIFTVSGQTMTGTVRIYGYKN